MAKSLQNARSFARAAHSFLRCLDWWHRRWDHRPGHRLGNGGNM